jgi:hypothetical protein
MEPVHRFFIRRVAEDEEDVRRGCKSRSLDRSRWKQKGFENLM